MTLETPIEPTPPNVVVAERWVVAIFVTYAVVPVLFFVILLLIPQSRDEALTATGDEYLSAVWLIGLAYLAYREIKRRPRSLTVKMGIIGALVVLELVNLLFMITYAAFYWTNGRFDGQVAAFLGGFFLLLCGPVLAGIGGGIGAATGWVIERFKGWSAHPIQMSEQISREPKVDPAKRWARTILLAYAIIPALFFVTFLLMPQAREDALSTTGYIYLVTIWLPGLAFLAHREIGRRPQSLAVKMAIVGALVLVGLVDLLLLITIPLELVDVPEAERSAAGALAGMLIFSPILGALGGAIGWFIGRLLQRRKLQPKENEEANPKLDDQPEAHTIKEPNDWVSGDEPMTDAQASYLKNLSEEAGQPEAFAPDLTRAEGFKRIEKLKSALGR